MPRHIYNLQSESIKVISGHVQEIADEMDVSARYIRSILQGTETDPFAKFLELYRAAVRAGAPVRHWDDRLAEIRDMDARGELNLNREVQRFVKESGDVPIAALDGDPHAVLREVREVNACGKKLETVALAAIARGGQSSVQAFAAGAVGRRNGKK